MSKVLVVGSQKQHPEEEFRRACQAIGAALARRGHTIIASGCGNADAETWVLDGANSATTRDKKLSVIPFAPAVPETQDLIVSTPGLSSRWPNLAFSEPFKTKGPWAVGQAVALVRSDTALLIGGGVLTANVGSLALELDKPYYAVSELGGAASVIAGEDAGKHRAISMPNNLLQPLPSQSHFGTDITMAMEFVLRHWEANAGRRELANQLLTLAISLAVLGCLLGFVFRNDIFGKEAQLVYTTCLGAITGVMLAYLIGRVAEREPIRLASLLGQGSLACFLGVIYGFFALEAASFYRVDWATWTPANVDALAEKMALLGVAVGALLGPASKKVLEELGRIAKF